MVARRAGDMGKQTAKTTERSFLIINKIQNLGGATASELATELDMAKSTVHVHLRTLLESGYLAREGEQYHIGLRFLNHGEYARSRKRAYVLAKNTVNEISDQIDEEVEFVVRNNNRGILVHESFHPDSQFLVKEQHAPNMATSAGIYYHLHNVATGKAILAELPEDHVESVLDEWGLPAQTDQTITEREALFHELERVREEGIAFTDEEYVDGLREVGRRVKTPDGSVLGAIAIIGPKYRFSSERFTDELPALLRDHVDELETAIEETYMQGHL